MITTLEMFGLINDYMIGKGHFATWEKDQLEKGKRGKGKGKKVVAKKKGGGGVLEKRRQEAADRKGKSEVKPTHFDLGPLKDAFKKFMKVDSRVRSELRTNLTDYHEAVRSIFKDENDQLSFKKCIAITELEDKLKGA